MHALRLLLLSAACSSGLATVTWLTNATNSASPWTGPPFITQCTDVSYLSHLIGTEVQGVTQGNQANMMYSPIQGGWTPNPVSGKPAYFATYLAIEAVVGFYDWTAGSGTTMIISAWIKWTGTAATATYAPIMQLGYTDGTATTAATYTGLQLFAAGTATANVMNLCVMFNAVNNPMTCGGSGRYISTTAIATWPSPKSTTGWTHITWVASPNAYGNRAVSVYQLYVNGELVQTQNTLPPTGTGIPQFSSVYKPTYKANSYNGAYIMNTLGFNFGMSATGSIFANQMWVGDLAVSNADADWINNPQLASAVGSYYGTACIASLYDTFPRVTPYSRRYISYNYPSNLTDTALAMPASAFTKSATTDSVPVTGILTPASCVNGSLGTPLTTPACGYGFILGARTSSSLQLGPAQDWGLLQSSMNTGYYNGGDSVVYENTPCTGFTVSTWVYRTGVAQQGYATRLFGVTPTAQYVVPNSYERASYTVSLSNQNTYAPLAATAANSAAGPVVLLSWPGCSQAYFYPPLLSASLSIRGPHLIVVAFHSTSPVIVSVDGVQYAYQYSNYWGSGGGACDLAYGTWPASLPSSIASAGHYYGFAGVGAEPGAWNIIDTTLHCRQVALSEVQAMLSGTSHQGAWPVPPPPPYLAPPMTVTSRFAACSTLPPIHRYGSAIANPFDGGVMRDFGMSDTNTWSAWPGMLVRLVQSTPQWLANASIISFTAGTGVPNGLLSNAYRVDFGARYFYGTGLTIGFLVSGGIECTPTIALNSYAPYGIPSAMTYFDFGGYSMYTIAQNCTAGTTAVGVPNVVTRVTNPFGASSSFSGLGTNTYSPLQPQQMDRYTFVVFSTTGTTVYVNGIPWASFPSVVYDTGVVPFLSRNTRFFGGNLVATSMTIHDLQIYQRALSPADVAALSKGVSSAC